MNSSENKLTISALASVNVLKFPSNSLFFYVISVWMLFPLQDTKYRYDLQRVTGTWHIGTQNASSGSCSCICSLITLCFCTDCCSLITLCFCTDCCSLITLCFSTDCCSSLCLMCFSTDCCSLITLCFCTDCCNYLHLMFPHILL